MSKSAAVPAKKRGSLFFLIAVIALSIATVGFLCSAAYSFASHKAEAIGDAAATRLADGFSCTADVTWNGGQYEIKLQNGASGTTMNFVKPENLKSLSFEDGAQGLKIKFGTLEAAVDASSIPQTSLFSAVTGAIAASANPGTSVSREGKSYVINGSTSAGKYRLTLDQNMTPVSLSVPSLKLDAAFKNFTFNQKAVGTSSSAVSGTAASGTAAHGTAANDADAELANGP